MMRHALVLLAMLSGTGMSAQPGQGVLRIRVTLADAAQVPMPVQRHVLLVSDNPATREPRRILTAADGTAAITLPPGSYIVESDRPANVGGRAYQWTQVVEIVAGRDATLQLTAENAEIVPLTESPSPTISGASEVNPESVLGQWQDSVVAVWSPTARATGFLVDQRGLIATDHFAVGAAAFVEVQFAPTVKVPGRVLRLEGSRGAALVWVDPSLVAGRALLPLACPPATPPTLDDGQHVVSIEAPHQRERDLVDGEVTALHPRRADTDLRLSFGGAGGPVFNESGAVVGLSSLQEEADARRTGDVSVVRTVFICEALAAASSALSGAVAPEPTRLPVEPTKPYPTRALDEEPKSGTSASAPTLISSSDFDVSFLTPPVVHRAKLRSGRTGGNRGRSPEAEARLGQLTEFGAWSEYFADLPAVLIVRVTPKLVEGFWKRLGREAARTQGAVLPPFKDFKTSFVRLRATCGGVDVTPLHPFVLEHRVSEKNVVREGLYVFDPEAFGPHCGTVTLSLYSEKQPEKADTLTASRTVIDQIWQDFAPYRAAAP